MLLFGSCTMWFIIKRCSSSCSAPSSFSLLLMRLLLLHLLLLPLQLLRFPLLFVLLFYLFIFLCFSFTSFAAASSPAFLFHHNHLHHINLLLLLLPLLLFFYHHHYYQLLNLLILLFHLLKNSFHIEILSAPTILLNWSQISETILMENTSRRDDGICTWGGWAWAVFIKHSARYSFSFLTKFTSPL